MATPYSVFRQPSQSPAFSYGGITDPYNAFGGASPFVYGSPEQIGSFNPLSYQTSSPSDALSAGQFAQMITPFMGPVGAAISGGIGLFGNILNQRSQARQAQQELANRMAIAQMQGQTSRDVANINTAPALQNAALARQSFERNQSLLNALLGGPGTAGLRGGQTSPLANQMAALFRDDLGTPATTLASQAMASQGDVLSGLMPGSANFFQGTSPQLFSQQMNQIMGGAAGALGGQLRGAQAGLGGAGMAAGSPVGQGIQRQFASQAAAGAQNALTSALLQRQGEQFARQQAQADYNARLAQLGLGQQQARQQFGLGFGQLGLGQQQQRLAQRGQRLGLMGQLLG